MFYRADTLVSAPPLPILLPASAPGFWGLAAPACPASLGIIVSWEASPASRQAPWMAPLLQSGGLHLLVGKCRVGALTLDKEPQ